MAALQCDWAQSLFRSFGLRAVYLFGSHARGKATERSDVDLAVLFPAVEDARHRLERVSYLEPELRRLLHSAIDLLTLNDCGPLLQFEAVVCGVTVYAPDDEERIRYEFLVRRRYEDFCHIQGFYTRVLREKLGLN